MKGSLENSSACCQPWPGWSALVEAEGLTPPAQQKEALWHSHTETTNLTCPPPDLLSSAVMRSSQIQHAATLLSEKRKKSL